MKSFNKNDNNSGDNDDNEADCDDNVNGIRALFLYNVG